MVRSLMTRLTKVKNLVSVLALSALSLMALVLLILHTMHYILFQLDSIQRWHSFPVGASKQAVMARFGTPDSGVQVIGDPLGVQEVLVFDSPLEVSIYFDQNSRMIAARRDIASILPGWNLLDIFAFIFFVILVLTLFFVPPLPHYTRVLGCVAFAFLSVFLNGYLQTMYPLAFWGPTVWILLVVVGWLFMITAIAVSVHYTVSSKEREAR